MRNIIFEASNCDYEEGYHVLIWEQNGNYFSRIKGHSVYCGDYCTKQKLTHDEALALMLEEEENEELSSW